METEEATQKIVIAGGGTGGHLFPALAVADRLRRRHPGWALTFVGARRGIETRLVPQAGYPLRTLDLAGLKGAGPLAKASAAGRAAIALARCVGWMLKDRPGLVIGVGGYASGPAVLAARIASPGRRIRTMVMEQNHFPGATNRFLARRVDEVCVPSGAARRLLGGVGTVTGNPVRDAFFEVGEAPGGERLSVFAFGGSRGARSINQAIATALPALARLEHPPRIVHQTGSDDEAEAQRSGADYPGGYEAHAFIDDMPRRLGEADLVICRAGAMTLAELAATGRPAVLVPYPFAADDHQRRNAETVAEAGAARVILDADLSGQALAACIAELDGDRQHLAAMGRASRTLAVPGATDKIADLAEALLGSGGRDVP